MCKKKKRDWKAIETSFNNKITEIIHNCNICTQNKFTEFNIWNRAVFMIKIILSFFKIIISSWHL